MKMIDKKQLLALRKATMLGISKCRDALIKTKGDFDKAIELLRKEGEKIASKRVNMEMHQGRVFAAVHANRQLGVMVSLTSETDFAANSLPFKELGKNIGQVALEYKVPDKAALLTTALNNYTVERALVEVSGQLKENIAIKEYYMVGGEYVGAYIHTGDKLGAMVTLNKATVDADIAGIAEDVAVKVAVSKPLAIDHDSLSQEVLSQEQDIIDELLKKENKPQHIIEKIRTQKIEKFKKDNALLSQPFFKDESETIATMLAKEDKELAISSFYCMQIS